MKLTLNSYRERNRSRKKRLIYYLIERLKITGTIRTTNWFYKSALKDRFYGISSSDARNFATQIDSMITVLNRVYEDKWDFHLEPIFEGDYFLYYKISVVIHYPEFIIENSDGRQHTIKDLLVTFDIQNNGDDEYHIYNLHGTRGFMSYAEWFVGYRHSHLTSNKPTSFNDVFITGSFCTGSGEINDVMATLWENGYSEEHFEMFLHTLNTVAEWESLEGIPYIKMESITIGKKQNLSDVSDSSVKLYYDYIFNALSDVDFDFVFSDNRYKIKQNEKYENIIKNIIINNMQSYWSKLLVTKVGDKYYGYSHPEIIDLHDMFNNVDGEKPYTLIQNYVVQFEVEQYSGELPDINNYKVHPKILNYAARELEKQLYYKSVRKSTIEKYNQGNNA